MLCEFQAPFILIKMSNKILQMFFRALSYWKHTINKPFVKPNVG